MEQTVDQTLQQGVAAHNAGNLQEAERCYRVILQVQPKHPDANHNLGLIAVAMNQSGAALPLFKTAIDVNPHIEKFWLSYIDALITERQFENANKALKKGKKKGVAKENLKMLRQKLVSVKAGNVPVQAPSQGELQKLINHYQNGLYGDAEALALSITQQFPDHSFSWKILGGIYKALGRMADALAAGKKAVELDPVDNQAHNSLGVILEDLGRFEEAEASYKEAISLKPNDCGTHYNLGNAMRKLLKFEEAAAAYRQAIAVMPDYAEAHSNLGITLQELGRLDASEASCRQAIAITPDYADAHYNLGNTLKELGNVEESEACYKQAVTLKPDYAEAHNNLGGALKELGRMEKSEASLRQAIALKPDYAEAHSNLGNTLQEIGRIDEAEASLRQAIALKSDFSEAYNSLGVTLQDKGRYDEAEASLRQAIALKSDYAFAHKNLGVTLYSNGNIDSALKSLQTASDIDPKSIEVKLLLSVITSRKSHEESKIAVGGTSNNGAFTELTSNTVILSRVVEAELISNLYGMSSRELDKTGDGDARFGSGACSPDFSLFEDTRPIVKTLAEDLTRIMMEAVKSEVFVYDSFFNILGSGGGTLRHRHLNRLDKDAGINLGAQKYSLVYYLCVGDQNCSSPGILKLYDPVEDILPFEGMITIIPASREHSAVYGGKSDRVMIGVNFYSL